MCRKLYNSMFFVLLLALAGNVSALNWTDGAADHLWSSGGNWQTGLVPTSADAVALVEIGSNLCEIDASMTGANKAVAKDLYGPGCYAAPGTTILNISGELSIVNTFNIGHSSGATGITNLSGSGAVTVGTDLRLGYMGNGTLNMTGGTLNATTTYIGRNSNVGTLNISNGTFTSSGYMTCGYYGTGVMNVTGGTVNANGPRFSLGSYASGTMIMDGGTMNTVETVMASGAAGAGSMTVNGGTFNTTGHFMVGENGTGDLTVDGGIVNVSDSLYVGRSSTGVGTLNIINGTLTISNYMTCGYYGTGVMNVTGGTVDANGPRFSLGSYASGTMIMDNGTMNTVETVMASGAVGAGSMTVNGGTFNTTGHFMVGESGSGSLTVDGGTVNVGNTLYVARLGTSPGDVALDDGTITASNLMISATGLMDIEAGTLILNGNDQGVIQTLIADNLLSGYGYCDTDHVKWDYDITNTGCTTVWAVQFPDTVWSPADFDESGSVDFFDYAILSGTWQKSYGDNDYNEICDIEDNDLIDTNDLVLFCGEWLRERHMPLEDSEYLSLDDDVEVTTQTTLLTSDIIINGDVHDVYLQSDGRFYPSTNVGLCSIYITVDGERVSNKSEIDWSTSSSIVQHCFNAIGLVSLSAGTHTISLVAESANLEAFTVGAGANLSILIDPAPVATETVLNSTYYNVQHTTHPYTEGTSVPSDTILSTNVVAGNEDIVAMISGVSSESGSPGDAMWGIYLDGLHKGCMYSSWTVSDIYHGAETLVPMYAHAFFPESMTSANNTVSFVGTEFPVSYENAVIYDIESTARLVVLGGGMSVAGNAHNVTSPAYNFYQWKRQVVGGYATTPPLGSYTELASEVISVPSGHNGIVMFVAKYRAQADSSDSGGSVSIWITIDGQPVGSTGVQQLQSPYCESQRTLCASYLAAGTEALSEGDHTVKVYGKAGTSGGSEFMHLAAHRETLLVWFD